MFLELLQALFIDGCAKLFRLDRDPDYIRMNREANARRDALAASVDDMTEEGYRALFPTFERHHAEARARLGLPAA